MAGVDFRGRVHAQTFVPPSHPPGEAQVDFGEATVFLNGEAVKVALCVMSLPYSDAAPGSSSGLIPASAPSRPRIFQDGHVRAFAFFGGIPTRISFFSVPRRGCHKL